MDLQPFSIVDEAGFRAYTAGLDSTYTLPSRNTLSQTILPQLYNEIVAILKIKLESAKTLRTDT